MIRLALVLVLLPVAAEAQKTPTPVQATKRAPVYDHPPAPSAAAPAMRSPFTGATLCEQQGTNVRCNNGYRSTVR